MEDYIITEYGVEIDEFLFCRIREEFICFDLKGQTIKYEFYSEPIDYKEEDNIISQMRADELGHGINGKRQDLYE